MFKTRYIFLFAITLVGPFHTINAVDWLAFFDRLIFGSNSNLGHVSHSRLILEGEEAEKKFVDSEVHKVSQPKLIKAQIEQNTIDINRWFDYHQTTNFIMRYIAAWAMDTLWEKREMLKYELRLARDHVDLEPFCHDRYHRNEAETDLICSRVFQNEFFRRKGWILDEEEKYKHCSRVSVSSLHKNEHNEHRKLVYYREARKCSAYTKERPEAPPFHFNVYLISHEVYLKRKQFAYFVFVSRDTFTEKTTSEEKGAKKTFKKILRYMKFWEEKKVKIVAYIED